MKKIEVSTSSKEDTKRRGPRWKRTCQWRGGHDAGRPSEGAGQLAAIALAVELRVWGRTECYCLAPPPRRGQRGCHLSSEERLGHHGACAIESGSTTDMQRRLEATLKRCWMGCGPLTGRAITKHRNRQPTLASTDDEVGEAGHDRCVRQVGHTPPLCGLGT